MTPRVAPKSTAPSAHHALSVPRLFRIALVILGIALGVYGTASLTGGWLGMPPWSTEIDGPWLSHDDLVYLYGDSRGVPMQVPELATRLRVHRVTWPAWPGAIVIGVGVGLFAFGAWPRRRQVSAAT